MNFTQKCKRFFSLQHRSNAGFTLVELIVVIAIMGILAGVGTVGYGAYVKKANMAADVTLADEVANALLMYYYAKPQDNMVSSVVLDQGGATVADGDAFAAAAMQLAFGDNWDEVAALKYGEWGNGAAVAKEVVTFFNDPTKWDSALEGVFNGSAEISYTDNISELFDLVEETSILIAGKKENLGSGANLVTEAAGITNGIEAPEGFTGTDAEYFAKLWASEAWDSTYLMNGTGEYGGDAGTFVDQQLKNAIANAGVIKARNVALATYLRDAGFSEVYDAIANYTYPGSVVPDDAAGVILKAMDDPSGLTAGEWEFIAAVFPAEQTRYDAMAAAIQKYYSTENGQSMAYNDGLAYYAMMSTVDSLKDSENLDKTDDSTWWNDLSSAIDMYAAVANGSVDLDDLYSLYNSMDLSGNTVVAMLVVENGVPTVIVSPKTANP